MKCPYSKKLTKSKVESQNENKNLINMAYFEVFSQTQLKLVLYGVAVSVILLSLILFNKYVYECLLVKL